MRKLNAEWWPCCGCPCRNHGMLWSHYHAWQGNLADVIITNHNIGSAFWIIQMELILWNEPLTANICLWLEDKEQKETWLKGKVERDSKNEKDLTLWHVITDSTIHRGPEAGFARKYFGDNSSLQLTISKEMWAPVLQPQGAGFFQQCEWVTLEWT